MSNSSLLAKSAEAIAVDKDSPSVNASFVLESMPLKAVVDAPNPQASPKPASPVPANDLEVSPIPNSNALADVSGGSPMPTSNAKTQPKRKRRGRRR